MTRQTIIKLVIINLLLSLLNVCVFSPALLNIDLFGLSALKTAIGVTVLILSIALFFYFNYKLIFKAPSAPKPEFNQDPGSLDDCAAAVKRYIATGEKSFRSELDAILVQIERMQKRETALHELIKEKFSSAEMSYAKFHNAVDGVKYIMILNVKNTIHRISSFDEDEYYAAIKNTKTNSEILRSKRDIFNDYAIFMKKSVDSNEEILIRVDKLILEISKLSEIHDGSVEDIDAVKEIDALINDAKWYK